MVLVAEAGHNNTETIVGTPPTSQFYKRAFFSSTDSQMLTREADHAYIFSLLFLGENLTNCMTWLQHKPLRSLKRWVKWPNDSNRKITHQAQIFLFLFVFQGGTLTLTAQGTPFPSIASAPTHIFCTTDLFQDIRKRKLKRQEAGGNCLSTVTFTSYIHQLVKKCLLIPQVYFILWTLKGGWTLNFPATEDYYYQCIIFGWTNGKTCGLKSQNGNLPLAKKSCRPSQPIHSLNHVTLQPIRIINLVNWRTFTKLPNIPIQMGWWKTILQCGETRLWPPGSANK